MAIITNTALENLRTTVRGEFKIAFQNANANSLYKKLATEIKSASKTNTYGWLSKFPQMREWVGDRVVKSMLESSYAIENKKYESTLGVDRADIEDDNLGQYSAIAQSMGQEANDFLDRKVAALLKDGFDSLCYDGQKFFDEEHPVFANADGTGTKTLVSNIFKKTASDSGSAWFLVSLNRPLKPFILQQRTGMEMESITDTKNDTVFTKDLYQYGIRWRGNFGYGLWQQALASKAELNADNFEAALAQAQSFKRDGGDPMGIRPTALVVPASLEADAKKILERLTLENGEGNINYHAVELIVNPWLG